MSLRLLTGFVVLAAGLAGCSSSRGLDRSSSASSFDVPCHIPSTERAVESDSAAVIVETPPVLIGGLQGLSQRLRYPESARRAGIEGKVCLQFIVDEEGRVDSVTVTRSAHPTLDAAAVAAVEASEFEPGTQRGEAVKVRFSLPVMFRLRDEPSYAGVLIGAGVAAAAVLLLAVLKGPPEE